MHYPSYIKSKVKHTLPAFPFHPPSPMTVKLWVEGGSLLLNYIIVVMVSTYLLQFCLISIIELPSIKFF